MHLPSRSLFVVGAVFLSAAVGAWGQSALFQVKDINQANLPPSTAVDSMVNVNGTLYLATDDQVAGAELWKLPPGGSEFEFVRDINPGPGGSLPGNLTSVNLTGGAPTLFFSATATGSQSTDLWRSDGTRPGTVLVRDLPYEADPGPSGPRHLTSFKGELYFEGRGSSPNTGLELWKSNGTAAGTMLLKDISPFTGTSLIRELKVVGDNLFFVADDSTGEALWATGGTEATTRKVKDINLNVSSEEFLHFVDVGGTLFFRAFQSGLGNELWKSDGTEEGTVMIRDIIEGSSSGGPRELTAVNLPFVGPTLFFTAFTLGSGRELWRSDGTFDNTLMVRDIRQSDVSEDVAMAPANLTAFNDFLFFTASQNGTGRELWRSNGVPNSLTGTVIVKDIADGPDGSNPANLTKVGDSLLFTVVLGGNLELWKSGGNPDGSDTVMVFDLPEANGTGAAAISNLVLVGNTLYFKLNDDEIWRTDGTEEGTFQIQRFRGGSAGSSPASFAMHNGGAYFAATTGGEGRELWKTDGTTAGTMLVSDIVPGSSDSNPTNLRSVGNNLFFAATNPAAGQELYVMDGQGAVSKVLDINNIDSPGSQPQHLTDVNGTLFFSANERTPDRHTGRELWKSDGTPGGTVLVRDINPGAAVSDPMHFAVLGNKLFFSAGDATNGRELWSSDGSESGTSRVLDIVGGGQSSNPAELVVFGGTLYFVATDSTRGREIWKSGGTDATTSRIKDIRDGPMGSSPSGLTVFKNLVFFAANDGVNGMELWRTNGSEAGTVMIKDIRPGTGVNSGSSPSQIMVVGDRLFFVADDGVNGAELWRSDGSSGGTVMVKDIVPGGGSPNIQNLTNVNGIAAFTAEDGANGRELWVSDGTANGTFMVRNLTGDDATSLPSSLFSFQGGLLFAAATRQDGSELYFAALGPDIDVQQPAGNSLVDGASTIDFGTVNFPANTTLPVTIRNTGLNMLSGIVASISGVHGTDYTIVTKPALTLGPNASTTLVLKFTPKENGPRNALLRIASTDGDENPFDINLTGTGAKNPAITLHPLPLMLQVGQSATFTAAAADPGNFTVKWLKNRAPVAGAVGNTHVIPSVALTHAGAYTFQAVNASKVTATSDIAELGVVENVPRILAAKAGTSVSLTVKAAGNGLTYLWKKGGNPLPADARFLGGTTKTLMIKNVGVGDTDIYTCEVSGPGGMAIGGETHLRVFDKPPLLDLPADPPADPELSPLPRGIVGSPYSYVIPLDNPNFERSPLTFSAAPLPPGVKLDNKQGVFFGTPTKGGVYTVKITASNSFAPASTRTVKIVIDDLPAGSVGAFAGMVARSLIEPVALGGMGGRIDITTTMTGSFSAKLILGTATYSFSGVLSTVARPDGNAVIANPTGTATVVRKGLPNLVLTFEIDYATNGINNASLSDGTNTQAFVAWRNVWNTKAVTLSNCVTVAGDSTVTCASTAALQPGMNVVGAGIPLGTFVVSVTNATTFVMSGNATLSSAAPVKLTADFAARIFEGLYNFALEGPGNDPAAPEGYGYGFFTVMKTGMFSGTVKTPDGESATWSSFISGDGDLLLFQTFYTPKGSIVGALDIDPLNLADPNDNTLAGAASLSRPPNPAASARVYEAGYMLNLTGFGARYVPPAAPNMILGLQEPGGIDNAELLFEDGSLPAAINPNVVFDIGPKSKITMPKKDEGNPALVKLTVVAATGMFSGSFTLVDPEQRTTGTFPGKNFTRTGTFAGILTRDAMGAFGAGTFKLDEMPVDGIAPTATDTNYGSVRLQMKP